VTVVRWSNVLRVVSTFARSVPLTFLRAGQWLGGVGVQYHHASTIRERPRAAGRSEDVRCSIATQRVAAWTREEPNQL
jgi:hypothetical protein